jgi:hypothetical protein
LQETPARYMLSTIANKMVWVVKSVLISNIFLHFIFIVVCHTTNDEICYSPKSDQY